MTWFPVFALGFLLGMGVLNFIHMAVENAAKAKADEDFWESAWQAYEIRVRQFAELGLLPPTPPNHPRPG